MYRYVQDYQNLICLTTLAKGWTVGEKLVQTQEDGFTPDRLRAGLLESFCPFGPESLFNPCGKCLSNFVRTSVLFWTFYRLQPGVNRTSYQTTLKCALLSSTPGRYPKWSWTPRGWLKDLYVLVGLEHVFFSSQTTNWRTHIFQILDQTTTWLYIYIYTGWWFGTCFPIYLGMECHHPNWRTHIFQRGRSTTNQYI